MKPQPAFLQVYNWKGKTVYEGEARQWCWMGMVLENIWDFVSNRKPMIERCPYGQPGDRLWVRETFWFEDAYYDPSKPLYRADGEIHFEKGDGWKPSIHMPRWASRILLEIVSVRVERLQEISPSDAIAEGVQPSEKDGYAWQVPFAGGLFHTSTAPKAFAWLWKDICGEDSWETNPWVWVVEFKRVDSR